MGTVINIILCEKNQMVAYVYLKCLRLQGKYWSNENILTNLEIREVFLAGSKRSLLVTPAYTCMSMIF